MVEPRFIKLFRKHSDFKNMNSLENEHLKVWIKPKGAELKSLVNKKTGIEHIWNSNPQFWAKSSPVLFPIVGGLKDNTYRYENKNYTLPRHGFARDYIFEIEKKSENEITYLLTWNELTFENYPFHFELRLTYTLQDNELITTYKVKNIGTNEMYFSLGAHPAFAVPFEQEEGYENYFLEFDKDEKLNRWPLTAEGLIQSESMEMALVNKTLPLTKKTFDDDALVFKDLQSKSISIKSKMSSNNLTFNFKDFPYFGIWAAKNANFVCLEPWCGIADNITHNQELTLKEGINTLQKGQTFERTWSVEVN